VAKTFEGRRAGLDFSLGAGGEGEQAGPAKALAREGFEGRGGS
jgi:hypothetical protein